jgi:hypothetical protein
LFLANLLVALILGTVGVIGFLSRRPNRTSAGLALLPLIDAAVLVGFVFGEDSYRDNGISRWDAYRRGRRQLLASTACLAGTTALLLVTATIIGFSAN